MTEARAMREARILAKHLSGRTVHLVGYSFGAPLVASTCSAFAKLGADAPCLASILLVDPLPFGSMPSDIPRNEDSLIASARIFDGLSSKLRYVDQEGSLVAAVQAGDVASASALVLSLREMGGALRLWPYAVGQARRFTGGRPHRGPCEHLPR